MKAKLNRQMNVSIAESHALLLEEIESKHGLSPTAVIRKLLESAADFYQAEHYLVFPVKITPRFQVTQIDDPNAEIRDTAAEESLARLAGHDAGKAREPGSTLPQASRKARTRG